ncbi:MAG: phosphoadenosine phosphosulfate reductase family protein [Methanomicrobiales archaeon]|nr:phosphoadenosine phosphosulfate reductase family protein [Methanomicrobiales archaeon]
MRPNYQGSLNLHWCDTCHVPVLAPVCACGARTRSVPVTPPGDARPAFPHDIALVNRVYEAHFGTPLIPRGMVALLNKVPDKDRMEEVIVGGAVVGMIRYISDRDSWEPIPRIEAGSLMRPVKRFVIADEGAIRSIRDEGASLLAPGLVGIDDEVRQGDEVFILDNDRICIGVGRSKVDADSARTMKKGVIVRTRRNTRSPCIPGVATWDDAVRANREVIARAEEASLTFVREVAARRGLPVNVSYSGGKDSLATLLVVQKALGKVPVLFADTGMEFPETYANIDRIVDEYDLSLIRCEGGGEFWKAFAEHGPPAVDARWCCGACKLSPVREQREEEWGECLSFIGQRKYESFARMQSSMVWRNRRVPNQLSAAPIHHWTALHVWLYLFREDAPYNVLYEQGFDRIGCYMCPSSDIAVLRTIGEKYPELWQEWTLKLEEWRKNHNLAPEWVQEARWRLKGGVVAEEDSNC